MFLSDFARKNLLIEFQRILSRAANKAIYDAKGKPTEPHLTKEIASQIPNGLYDALTSYIHGYEFEVHAIFCHQFPYAKFLDGTNRKCEIGDMLFIYCEKDKTFGKALLLQAKKIEDSKFIPKNNEKTQLDLYTKSPDFTYVLSTEKRKIPNDDSFNEAQYLFMYKPFCNDSDYRTELPKNILTYPFPNNFPLADKLLELISDTKKGNFSIDGNSKDDWSKIIQDFLELKYSTNQNLHNQKNKRDNFAGGISFVSVKNIEELFDCEYLKETVAEINKNENLSNQNIPEETKPFLVVYINSNPKNKEYLKEGWW